MRARIRASIATIVALSSLLTGCATSGTTFVLIDLGELLSADDDLRGAPFTVTRIVGSVNDDLFLIQRWWSDQQGSPQECFGMYLMPYLAVLDDPNGFDQTVEIGYVRPPGTDVLLYASGRILGSPELAAETLDALVAATTRCPSGYSLEGQRIAAGGFRVTDLPYSPDEVDGVVVDALDASGVVEARIVLIHRGNALVALQTSADELLESSVLAESDSIVAIVAERLAAR